MPQDYEINWREHRSSIKGRNIFRMILNSSFKHQTASMRFLFVVLTCLAACSALPQLKQKRDILPGDPRYENHHHHNHENVIEDAKTSTGYSFSSPGVPQDTYGPPGLQPGVPLNEDYLSPVVDVAKHSTAATLTQQVPDFVHHPEVIKKSDELHDVHVEKTVTDVAVEEIKSVTVAPPATSYGTPVLGDVKIAEKSEIGVDAHVKNVETVKTEIDNHEVIDVHPPSVKVVEHIPVKQEVTHVATDVKTVPAVTTTVTKGVNPWLNGDIAKIGTSFAETFDVPSFDLTYGLPSSFYNYPQSSFNTFQNGFSSYGLSSVEVPPPLPLSLHGTNSIPTSYSFAQDVKIPHTDFHVPYSLGHFVQRTQPGHILQSLPSASSFDTFSPSAHSAPSIDSLTAVHPVSYTDTLTKVHADASVKTIESPPTIQHAVHSVPSVKSVETVSTVHSVPTVKTIVHAAPTVETLVKNLPTLHPLPTVKTVHPVETLSTVHSSPSVDAISSFHVTPTVATLSTLQSLPTVKTVHPAPTLHPLPTVKTLHPVESVSTFHSLPTVKTVHPVETLSTVHSSPSVEAISSFHVTPTVATLPTLHSLPTVKTVHPAPTLHSLPTVKTISSIYAAPTVETLSTVQHPVPTVKTISSIHAAPTLETFPAIHSLPTVKTVPTLHATPTVDTLTHVDTLHSVNGAETVSALHPVSSLQVETDHTADHGFKTDEHVQIQTEKGVLSDFIHGIFSQFGSGHFPGFPPTTSTVATPTQNATFYVANNVHQDSLTIENPLLSNDDHVLSSIPSSSDYVQPTDINGGYIYRK